MVVASNAFAGVICILSAISDPIAGTSLARAFTSCLNLDLSFPEIKSLAYLPAISISVFANSFILDFSIIANSCLKLSEAFNTALPNLSYPTTKLLFVTANSLANCIAFLLASADINKGLL